ncbi:ATP-dependent helicase/nuclease subunit A [Thalassovita gelatinovora]|uniref:DNA 3'-5' helicase n=1 Tax=Thalassovita gelatinovora TaxID=53501 RepID=A0A0P1FZX6_THAGE|nr:double-strand break repair helicase AddA [Thalassovita gelatinovora]QIZ81038.1 double-strand break repair helicase AddA [Thalassovita gelatinovora]CUH65017.1 ATP-dependent helicase/nuclease subunit A [Thalassovita gelatinovora]SEP87898.1 DNA helicase/exodeoxyribonuclease V, subunit A [Thalassovita gelatinovora]
MTRDEATEKQVQAARPKHSTWLSANAGSGKTRVLTDRVARLLLEKVQPQHILCLTYTKAAASEMQNRLFKRLGEWAMLDAGLLRDQLVALGVAGPVTDEDLRNARTLFARAIETPGGLKIQTIHSFCSSLLRRFPLEARVSPQFAEMEERAASLLRAEIVQDLADGPDAAVVRRVAHHFTGEDFDSLTASVVQQRVLLQTPLGPDECRALFDLDPGFDEETLRSTVFLGDEDDLLQGVLTHLQGGSANDVKAADKLRLLSRFDLNALPVLESIFLFGESAKSPFGAKIGSFPTKKTQTGMGPLLPRLEDFMRRVEDARAKRLALAAAHKTHALQDFARVFLPAYEARKQKMGWLDFDDLILKARDLLTNPAVAAWVLYRLDGGIDHILVDEAQDTSPAQWKVIELLAQEFTSGAGARSEVERTIFVVGDKKQSIYSFQGADPREFDRMQAEFAQRLATTERPLNEMELQFSFRSSQAILALVDEVFRGREASGFHTGSEHRAFKDRMPGRVDLWPVVEKTDEDEDDDWDSPVDRLGMKHHSVLLAERIARQIRRMIDEKETVPAEIGHSGDYQMRPVSEGDFLILVQRRSDLFAEIIRACKEQGLAIAGADRLKVGAELAVRDLAALMNFLATPEDNYSLAVALKSPLFGWNEQKLFDFSHRRSEKYLWQALRQRREEIPEVMSVLDDLRSRADYMRPYDLIERILTRHDGRRKLLARLGAEAEDGINAFLSQALAFERSAIPSLIGFLQWMETDDLEIKRQMDSAGNRIRVMTVHGAKGLEAPIVILPDTAKRTVQLRDDVLTDDGQVMWRTVSGQMPERMQAARDKRLSAEEAERDRLLYVAMTRAEKWLIVAAAGDLGKDGQSWYEKIGTAMERLGAKAQSFAFGDGLRLCHGDWSGEAAPVPEPEKSETVNLPGWAQAPAPVPRIIPKTLSPSDLGGAKALPGEDNLDEDAAKLRGRQIHLLLEHMPDVPQSDWPGLAEKLLGRGTDAAASGEIPALLAEVVRVLTEPDLLPLFSAEALAEVPVSATIAALNNRRIHGTIDRLIITKKSILAVDFKTNAVVPEKPEDCPLGLLRQMGAYAHALVQIYPYHQVQTAILWTRTARLMTLPAALTTQSLESTCPT